MIPETEQLELNDDSTIMPTKRKAELFNVLIKYLLEMFCDTNELGRELEGLGFTNEEIHYAFYKMEDK